MKYLFLFLIVLSSCNPIQRHARIVKRFPHVHTIENVELVDTVHITTDVVQIDTVTLLSALKDTVTLVEDNLIVKVFTVRDSIYINAKCDTIFIDKIITRTIPVKYYKENTLNWNWLWVIVALVVAYFLLRK
jgi:hypothetical protein